MRSFESTYTGALSWCQTNLGVIMVEESLLEKEAPCLCRIAPQEAATLTSVLQPWTVRDPCQTEKNKTPGCGCRLQLSTIAGNNKTNTAAGFMKSKILCFRMCLLQETKDSEAVFATGNQRPDLTGFHGKESYLLQSRKSGAVSWKPTGLHCL